MGNHQCLIYLFIFVAAAHFCLCCMAPEALAYEINETTTPSPITVHRFLVENVTNPESLGDLTSRTERVDPLDGLKKYRGGYNISNNHYWSSAIFAGKYGYSIAALWLLGGIVYAGVLLYVACCFNNKTTTGDNKSTLYSKRCRIWPLLVGALLTLLAISASIVVLRGSSKFDSRARSVTSTIMATTQEAGVTISNVTKAVDAMKAGIEPYNDTRISKVLKFVSSELNHESASIKSNAEKNMSLVTNKLKRLKVAITVTVAVNLAVVISLLASAQLGLHQVFQLLIIISWLLTTAFWIYFGLYFFLDKFAGDTCAALAEYKYNPKNSSLNSILPCNDELIYARSVMSYAGGIIHHLIKQGNSMIRSLKIFIPDLKLVCDPFSEPPLYVYQPGNCSSNTIQVGDLPQALERYACSGSGGATCKHGEFLAARDYSRVQVYTSSLQNILDLFPDVQSLVSCQVVKDTFSDIASKQCKPLWMYLRMTWIALAALSTIMVALVLTWTLEAHRDRRYRSSNGSVKPQVTSSGMSEVDSSKMDTRTTDLELQHSQTHSSGL